MTQKLYPTPATFSGTTTPFCRPTRQLAQGKSYCTLFVDKRNPISNRVYRKIGFAVLEDCSEYKLVK